MWLRRGIKARRTRDEGRVKRLMEMRAERAARRSQIGTVRLSLEAAEASGKLVIEAEHVTKAFGDRVVVRDFSTRIMRGDRIGLIGPNGAGKTTLLRLLLGELPPDAGTVRHGANVQVAYYDQQREQLDPERTVVDTVGDGNDRVTVAGRTRHVHGYLEDFLFPPERARSPVKALSGGERNRLLLARLFTRPANVLVLDEPTNDLDLETLELLEAQLVDWPGTLLVVSHDRRFLDHVVTSTIAFEGDGRLVEYVGGYDDWVRQRPQSPVGGRAVAPVAGHACPRRHRSASGRWPAAQGHQQGASRVRGLAGPHRGPGAGAPAAGRRGGGARLLQEAGGGDHGDDGAARGDSGRAAGGLRPLGRARRTAIGWCARCRRRAAGRSCAPPSLPALLWLAAAHPAWAHGVSAADRTFMERGGLMAFLYLGAKHMVTGYDHLLFLFGVIFFLYRMRDVGLYVTLFAVGHSVTLLYGVLSGTHVNAYLVDAMIGFSVVYKALDNLGAFRRWFGVQPDTKAAVFVFGLIHGFGLATKLQDFALPRAGLAPKIVAFNAGVEIGQLLALAAILIAMAYWRRTAAFSRQAFAANVIVMTCGFVLMGYQLTGYFVS